MKKLLVVILGFLVLAVYGYRIYFPAAPYFDETYYVSFSRELLSGHYAQSLTSHPPLWNLLNAFAMKILGDYSWAWRMVSLVSGFLVLTVLYPLTKQITRSANVAWLAVFIMTFDCISLTQARVAMMNSTMLLFILLSLLFMLYSIEEEKISEKLLFVSGIFFGLALSTKYLALNLALFFAPLLSYRITKQNQGRLKILLPLGFYLILVPILIFIISQLFIPFLKDRSFDDIWKILNYNLHYHLTTKQTHLYMSPWWTWPLMPRPIWFFFKADLGSMYGILCIGNPAVFWAIPLAMAYALWGFFKGRSSGAGLILLGFLTQWLCYMLIGRLKFFHYFYTAMPFVAMAIAYLLNDLWQKGKIGRMIVTLYLLLVAGMFVYWYPLLTGFPISEKFYSNHMWFRSWI